MNFYPNFNNPFQAAQPINTGLSYQQPVVPQQLTAFRTNRILVTSLNEALTKQCDYGSEMYYWDQSRPVIYVVRTNMQGVKEWAEIQYIVPSQQETPVDKFDDFERRLRVLEEKLSNANKRNMSELEVNTDE